eukprot:gnl/Chilomastix_cuspidata/4309.p1 GENE.gnl/Chilomastix_cuspidata/4309~~gnl/Chilomastix_cuspidata/4309.p1  ORF type:complete len:311 (+),score=70.37 gnl/Chilomastix_cuspidata/4309:102-935(+)
MERPPPKGPGIAAQAVTVREMAAQYTPNLSDFAFLQNTKDDRLCFSFLAQKINPDFKGPTEAHQPTAVAADLLLLPFYSSVRWPCNPLAAYRQWCEWHAALCAGDVTRDGACRLVMCRQPALVNAVLGTRVGFSFRVLERRRCIISPLLRRLQPLRLAAPAAEVERRRAARAQELQDREEQRADAETDAMEAEDELAWKVRQEAADTYRERELFAQRCADSVVDAAITMVLEDRRSAAVRHTRRVEAEREAQRKEATAVFEKLKSGLLQPLSEFLDG